jgi:hypothetical protein
MEYYRSLKIVNNIAIFNLKGFSPESDDLGIIPRQLLKHRHRSYLTPYLQRNSLQESQ